MVYVAGIIGFIGGFFLGQLLLLRLLKNRSNEELMTNRWLRLQYGIMNWTIAAASAYCMVEMYGLYFGSY
jgi:putative copper export protein